MVRGRVVGILYGEGNIDACYDEHLAGLSRGGGLALERILKSKLITIPPLPES
jgi:hypothetical protein